MAKKKKPAKVKGEELKKPQFEALTAEEKMAEGAIEPEKKLGLKDKVWTPENNGEHTLATDGGAVFVRFFGNVTSVSFKRTRKEQ